jgi:hypothetical protein
MIEETNAKNKTVVYLGTCRMIGLTIVFITFLADIVFAAENDLGKLSDMGAFQYVIFFDGLVVMWCLHKIYHSIFSVYYFSLQAFLGELVTTGLIAFFILFMIPAYFDLRMGGVMSYLYFGGILVLTVCLIAFSGKKSEQTENKTD